MQKATRLKRELLMLQQSPPPGISCSQDQNEKDILRAQIIGSEGTPYHGGLFVLTVTIPDRYPFEPPKVVFATPIYHPNIDTGGRICLDTLKMPPQGAWKPSLNIGSVLTTIQLLMAEPNPDDPLMTEISTEYKYNRHLFNEKAKKWTRKHAISQELKKERSSTSPMCSASSDSSDDEGFVARDRRVAGASIGGDRPQCSGIGSNSRKRNSSDSDPQSDQKKRLQSSSVDL